MEEEKLPNPESPLADYYVPKARDLCEESDGFFHFLGKNWAFLIAVVLAFIVAVAVSAFAVWSMTKKRRREANDISTEDGPINPQKHKMIATVLVDMRINDPILRGRTDVLDNRDSETDLSMTDTEGTFGDVNKSEEKAVDDEIERIMSVDSKSHRCDNLIACADNECNNLMASTDNGCNNLMASADNGCNNLMASADDGYGQLTISDQEEYLDPLAPIVGASMQVRRRHKAFYGTG